MTINLTELRDEPLGKHPIQALGVPIICYTRGIEVEQDVVAADHESTSTFDVDSLNDEALDAPLACLIYMCAYNMCRYCKSFSDEQVDTQGGGA